MVYQGPNNPNFRPNGRRDGNDSYNNSNRLERNKFRQTMPSNSRYKPLSPPERNQISRLQMPDNTISPTQSHTSTITNYAQPWNSPKFPDTPKRDQEEPPRFRRTHSVAVRNQNHEMTQEEEKKNRPKITFMEMGKKFTSKFKKGDSKKRPQIENVRLSAPNIKLGQSSVSSSSSETTLEPASTTDTENVKKKSKIQVSNSLKMQKEDRMKMYQKMGREQLMKQSNLQRMQQERQRDFTLVPGPGRACLEAKTSAVNGSSHSIDSMVVISSTPTRNHGSGSLSMADDDVEPIFRNSLNNQNVTSSQVASLKNQKTVSGPEFTSTPRLDRAPANSPTISNVSNARSISESSFCMVTPDMPRDFRHPPDNTIYYSACGLSNGNGRDTPASVTSGNTTAPRRDLSIVSTSSTPTLAKTVAQYDLTTVKREVVEQESGSSHCPSISSTPSSEKSQLVQVQSYQQQPGQLNDLWKLSTVIREQQLELEQLRPLMERMARRCAEIDNEKAMLLNSKGDNPDVNDLNRLWSLDRELLQISCQINTTGNRINLANNLIPFYENRRNELLSQPPPSHQMMSNVPASFV